MSQGSDGSPVQFLNRATCNDILVDLRGVDGRLPTFDSERGTPPPALVAEVARGERGSQTSHSPMVQNTVTQVDQVTVEDQFTQVLIRPSRLVTFTQTATAPRSTRTS